MSNFNVQTLGNKKNKLLKSDVNSMDKVQDAEIDLLSLFQTIWDGKWKILSIMAISLVLCPNKFGF